MKNAVFRGCKKCFRKFFEKIWAIIKKLVVSFIMIFEGIVQLFSEQIDAWFSEKSIKKKQDEKIIREAVNAALEKQSNLTYSYRNRKFVRVFTGLLQFISFVTTYQGFIFFLGEVNPVAPLFMALVVQGGCYYILNSTSTYKHKGNWKRIALLLVLSIISTTTSYMGIFNGIENPTNIMEEKYKEFAIVLNGVVDDEKSKFLEYDITSGKIYAAQQYINQVFSVAEKRVVSLEEEISEIKTENVVGYKTEYNEEGQLTFSRPLTNTDASAMKSKLQLVDKKDKIESYLGEISANVSGEKDSDYLAEAYNSLKKSIEAGVKGNVTDSESNYTKTEYYKAVKEFSALLSTADALEKIIYDNSENSENTESENPADEETETSSTELSEENTEGEETRFEDFYNLQLSVFEEKAKAVAKLDVLTIEESYASQKEKNEENETANNDEISEENAVLFEKIKNFVQEFNAYVVSQSGTDFEDMRNDINKIINDRKNRAALLVSQENAAKISTAAIKSEIDNTQLFAFSIPYEDIKDSLAASAQDKRDVSSVNEAVASAEVRTGRMGEAFISLLIAMLVDSLSIMIAFALVNRRKSILYFAKTSDYPNSREELISECLGYLCVKSLLDDEGFDSIKKENGSEITKYVAKKLNEIMYGFMDKVHPVYLPDSLGTYGYITQEDVAAFDEDNKFIFQTLNNIAAIHPCTSEELITVLENDLKIIKSKDKAENSKAQINRTEGNTAKFDVQIAKVVEKYNTDFQSDKMYYLVTKNLHIWFCENFSELMENAL